MRNVTWFATAAVAALILGGVVVWTNTSTEAFVPVHKFGQVDPLQIMTNTKDLPNQAYEDRTFVF